MIPRRHLPDSMRSEERMHVLVPGLFGLGFVISLVVLAGDFIGRLLPASGKRRWAEIERHALGRSSDMAAIRSGEAPIPGVVDRVPRGRMVAFSLAALAGLAATASIVAGFALAARVGLDRQGWALGAAFVIAIPVSLFGLMWLLSGALGRRAPRWLNYLSSFWPFGTYPEPHTLKG